MARRFEFTQATRSAAFLRQDGRCALCRRSLRDQEEFGHHVVPDQSGQASDPRDRFLKSVDNCVMICEACHWIVHDGGRWATGAVPPPEYYPYSHPGRSDHLAWVGLVKREYLRIFARRARSAAASGSSVERKARDGGEAGD